MSRKKHEFSLYSYLILSFEQSSHELLFPLVQPPSAFPALTIVVPSLYQSLGGMWSHEQLRLITNASPGCPTGVGFDNLFFCLLFDLKV